MPNDVKAVLSVVTLVVAIAYAYWERAYGQSELFWISVGFGVFSVVAMWVFPEAKGGGARGKAKLND